MSQGAVASRWHDCRAYLAGMDLFNHGYYWEAHEAWEAVWRAVDRDRAQADFLKGLIKLSAAGVKAREGRVEGVRRHGQRALELFAQVNSAAKPWDGRYMGLSLEWLSAVSAQVVRDAKELVRVSDRPVEIIFPFVLQPT